MSQDDEFSISDLRRKREQAQSGGSHTHGPSGGDPSGHGTGAGGGSFEHVIQARPVGSNLPARPAPTIRRANSEEEEEGQSEWSVDIWRVLGAMKRHWYWLVAGAGAVGCAGLIGGYLTGKYSASIDLIQIKAMATPAFQPEAFSPATLIKLIQSPELMRQVARKSQPPLDPSELADSISISHQDNTELTTLSLTGQDASQLAAVANLYAEEIVAYTKELQQAGARRSIQHYKEKVELFDREAIAKNGELATFLASNNVVNPESESEAYTKQVSELFSLQLKKESESQLADLTISSLESQLGSLNPLAEQLGAANARLVSLQAKFKDEHPLVQDTLAEIAAIEQRIKAGGTTNSSLNTQFPAGSLGGTIQREIVNLTTRKATLNKEIEQLRKQRIDIQKSNSGLSELTMRYAGMRGELESLQNSRKEFAGSLHEAELYERRSEGFFRFNTPITRDDVNTKLRIRHAILTGFKGGVAGLLLAAGLIFLVEMKHRTMKTVAEVERITGQRVLATLGDLSKMSEAEQDKWAFRTWTIIAGQLNMSANRGMVCGVMSSVHGEGRSTWIRLLGNAASRRGLRVLTVATKPSTTDPVKGEAETQANERSFTDAVAEAMQDSAQSGIQPASTQTIMMRPDSPDYMALDEKPLPEPETLSPNVLAFPAEVTQKFNAGELPAAHIPLPGWVWSLERRRQWQNALTHWRSVDNLVLLVELPPASVPESVLLAENLPQILWLVDSGKPDIRETKLQLEMLHHARCRIVGAVLNHEPEPIIKL
jgi:uncharacterized protein involved in exopolysaccharide biosynthesis/Mrp family chromosome partitioning ATPase